MSNKQVFVKVMFINNDKIKKLSQFLNNKVKNEKF